MTGNEDHIRDEIRMGLCQTLGKTFQESALPFLKPYSKKPEILGLLCKIALGLFENLWRGL